MLGRLRRFVTVAFAERESGDELFRELDALERRLREERRNTELLAKLSYTRWKLRQEQEKQYAIRYGVTMPSTTLQREQHEFFAAMERRIENEHLRFLEEQRATEGERQQEERIALERQAAERVLRVLEEDLQ